MGTHCVQTGDIIFYHKNEIHNFAADVNDPCCYAWITFSSNASDELLKHLGLPAKNFVYHSDHSTEIYKLLYDLMYTDIDTRSVELSIASSFLKILNLSSPNHLEKDLPVPTHSRNDYIDLALKYIKENYSDPKFSVKAVSEHLGLNHVYFGSLFKKATRLSLIHYLVSYRIRAAQTLLNATNYTIQEIAFLVGFQSYQRFFEAFRHHTGNTPTEFRNQRRQ